MSLRVIIGFLLVAFWMFGIGTVGLVVGVFEPRRRLLGAIIRGWAKLVLLCAGVQVRVEGREHVPSGPAVYAANHVSALDIPLLFACLPVDFRIIHKKSLYWAPVIGGYLYFGGHIGVDRANPFKARQSLKRAAQRIRQGLSVTVFPEGTRSRDGRLQAFKRGSFVLAQDAGVPVVPVSLIGVKALVPQGLVRAKAGRVTLRIHPPVPTAGRTPDAVADEVREIILRDIQEPAA